MTLETSGSTTGDGAALELENISKSFTQADGSPLQVLDQINFEVRESEFVSIMGPSGCGKSTLLNIIAGLEAADSGAMKRNDTEISPDDLSYAYVFQEPRLLNWRTCRENVHFALKGKGIPKEQREELSEHWLTKVGLGEDMDNFPLWLSGGMRQRAGLARALATDPDILLMDEPFSSLDEVTARQLRSDLLVLWQDTQKQIVFVTHDIKEAVFLSDRILFMNNDGKIFKKASISHPRPRDMNDTELLEKESELTDMFFEKLE